MLLKGFLTNVLGPDAILCFSFLVQFNVSCTPNRLIFNFVGERGSTKVRKVQSNRLILQRSNIDAFVFGVKEDLGDLIYIELCHDNSGGGWHLR